MLFSTAAAPAASFSCFLSFAVETLVLDFTSRPRPVQGPLQLCRPCQATCPTRHTRSPCPGRGVAHSLSLHVGRAIGRGKRAPQSYLKDG